MSVYNPYPKYINFTDYTPVVPELYWNVYSAEERIKALCMEWVKLTAYVDGISDTINGQYAIIKDMQERLPDLIDDSVELELRSLINSGEFNNMLNAAIEEYWGEYGQRISNVESNISNIESNITTLNESVITLSHPFRVMVVLGDSWSDESNDPATTWLSNVANGLGFEAYFTNAKAGNGFAHGGANSIPNQVQGALSKVIAGGYTASDVTHVIAMGGVNDYRRGYTYQQTANGAATTYLNARNTFPNAKIYLIGANAGKWDVMDTLDPDVEGRRESYAEFPTFITYLTNNLRNRGYPLINDVGLWFNGYGSDTKNLFNDDNLHPNQTGVYVLASYIKNILLGEKTSLYKKFSYNRPLIANDETVGTLNISNAVTDAGYSLAFKYTGDAIITNSTIRVNIGLTVPPLVPGGENANITRFGFIASNYTNSGISAGCEPIRCDYNALTGVLTIYPSETGGLNQMFGSATFKWW